MKMKSHSIFKYVYYDDTDGGGVVYHANYLNYMDHARSDFLKQQGFELQALLRDYKIFFAVTQADLRYLRPARLSDELEVTATLANLSAVSMSFKQHVMRVEGARRDLLLEASVTVVCLNSDQFKPVKIPKPIREKLACDD
jgi:acyl-CoA thioester hydrolase